MRIHGPATVSLLWTVLLLIAGLPAVASAGPGAAGPQAVDRAPSMGRFDPGQALLDASLGAPSATDPPDGGRPMDLDIQGADIRTVLRSISAFADVNIIADVDISGPVNVRLKQVPWRRALDVVCQSAGLIAVTDGDVLRVATRKTLSDESLELEASARKQEEVLPLETVILPVRYATAEELKTSLEFALSKRGSAEVDARTNSILVTDIGERVEQIRRMVEELDTETLQVEITARLVDMDATAARQLGISWSMMNLHSAGERTSVGISHETPLAKAATELKFAVIRPWGEIEGKIQALETANKANLILNPSITTVNNRQARILVGKEVPLIVLDQAGNPITELKKVGITLEVTPYINSENQITMDLHPEVSDLASEATVQGGIVFTMSEADTRVMVQDGGTAVIGGLTQTRELRFEQGLPILRSIPLLGHLFKTSDVRKETREIMIFVTPTIVRGMASTEKP
jgi:type IV pilus assembly protein PilQ